MVKGITRQVVVVKGGEPELFEQAIFLVKDSALSRGGVTEEALLKEARRACAVERRPLRQLVEKLLWAAGGAAATGLVGLLIFLI